MTGQLKTVKGRVIAGGHVKGDSDVRVIEFIDIREENGEKSRLTNVMVTGPMQRFFMELGQYVEVLHSVAPSPSNTPFPHNKEQALVYAVRDTNSGEVVRDQSLSKLRSSVSSKALWLAVLSPLGLLAAGIGMPLMLWVAYRASKEAKNFPTAEDIEKAATAF